MSTNSNSRGRTTQSTCESQSRDSSSTAQSTSSKSRSKSSSSNPSGLSGLLADLDIVGGPSWTIKDSPLIAAGGGHGKGMFATRAISAGEVILTDMPLLMLRSSYANGDDDPVWSTNDRPHEIPPKDVYEAFGKLSTKDRLYYLTTLSHVATSDKELLNFAKDVKVEFKSHDERIKAGKVLAIWENNVLQAEGELQVLCKNVSRINHSCVPNAVHTWNFLSGISIRAICDIPAGTEVLISYVRDFDCYAKRAEDLTSYGFRCTCSACDGSNYCRESAERRRELDDLELTLVTSDPDGDGTPETGKPGLSTDDELRICKRMLQVMAHEPSMRPFEAEIQYHYGYRLQDVGRTAEAVNHLEAGFRLLTICQGSDHPSTKGCKEKLDDCKDELDALKSSGKPERSSLTTGGRA